MTVEIGSQLTVDPLSYIIIITSNDDIQPSTVVSDQ